MRQFINLVENTQLNELSRPEFRGDAWGKLRDAGYEWLGGGSFGNVLRKPGADYVLKLFDAEDEAYLAYLKVVRAHSDNPHFPKVFGKTIKVTDEYYAVRLEPLTSVTSEDGEITTLINNYMTYDRLNFDEPFEPLETARAYLMNHPALKDACDIILDTLIPKYRIDLINRTNMLRRGDTLVFSDPVAPRR